MIRSKLRYLLTTAIVVVLGGCGLDPVSPNPSEQLIIQALLQPGHPVDNIRLTRTMPPESYYSGIPQSTVSGATVILSHESRTDTLSETAAGIYGDSTIIARSGVTYRVEVSFEDIVLRAETTIPEKLDFTSVVTVSGSRYIPSADTIIFPREYANPEQFPPQGNIPPKPITVSWDAVPLAAGYEFAAIADDTTGTEFLRKDAYEDWLAGDYATAKSREWTRMTKYPVFSGYTETDVLWAAFNYRGDHNIVVRARDRNYNDFAQTVSGSSSGNDYDTGTVMYVEGGIGLFGSFSSDTLNIHIVAEWLPSENL